MNWNTHSRSLDLAGDRRAAFPSSRQENQIAKYFFSPVPDNKRPAAHNVRL
jgi:hypothetical protein